MRVKQAEFLTAVLDSSRPVPSGLISLRTLPTKRFSVYRNNVVVGLSDALASAFPVTQKLLGDEFFRAMAGLFVRRFPPQSPMLMEFGSDLPDFLADFPPVAHLPYLPDVARLEILVRESYHEADSQPVDREEVLGISQDRLALSRLQLAPSARLMRSGFPACGIWRANALSEPRPKMTPEDILVVRRGYDPEPVLLPPGGYEIMERLLAGASLMDACDHAASACGEVRLDETLSILVSYGAIAAVAAGP